MGDFGVASLWSSTATPTVADAGPDSPVEVGVKLVSSVAGRVMAIRFYKSVGNTGTHVGNLWDSSGTLLGSATFSGETASGWQQVSLSSPVSIGANEVHVASYHTDVGHYAGDQNYFGTSEYSNGPLKATKDGAIGPNGVYVYGSTSQFPATGFNASNYWVDLVFSPTGKSIWSPSSSPVVSDSGDTGSLEVGVRFRSDVAGSISAIRFYKSAANTGTHVGNLWDSSGNLLGSATFSNETASGWQQVELTTPVSIDAGTDYVASCFMPNGHYAADYHAFDASSVDNVPLHAVKDGAGTPNGCFTYSPTSAFPTLAFNSSNYWVDVVFVATGTPTTTTLTVDINPALVGQSVTFTATVAPQAGQGKPTGTVTFYDGSTVIGTGTLS